MSFKLIHKTATSLTLELEGTGCYYPEKNYLLYVNGVLKEQVKTNCFTIHKLLPASAVEVKWVSEDRTEECCEVFYTEEETAVLNVKDFGAIGDGKHLDTVALQAAIMAAPKGARVVLPKGIYKSTPLFLKSDMTLELEEGAVLLGEEKREKYPILPGVLKNTTDGEDYYLSFWEGTPDAAYASLITGIGIQNTKIVGEGMIDGNGNQGDWWIDAKVKRTAWRPRTINLVDCKDIVIEGVKIQNSPSWTVHPIRCQNIRFINLIIENPKDSPNTDGIDPESCKNVEIIGVRFSLGDDCIAIKSGKYSMPREKLIPSERIIIRNCLMEFGHGAVVVGSEMSGGVKDVHVERCLFRNTDRGVRVKTRRGRGSTAIIDQIHVENIKMEGVLTPFTINAFYFCDPDGKTPYVWDKAPLPKDERTPYIGELTFKNIVCRDTEVCAGFIYGLPEEKIKSLWFKNVSIDFKEDAQADYPEMLSFQEKTLRAGFHFKNVCKLKLENVTITNQIGNPLELEAIEDYLVE
ncbi:polygalacturonase [Sporanaerobium hydrogeniformans]|uniref:Polygalacturonase n=1 Tax=Sporanaerobium hydrogeniformans TaxID=3072179 RepID=A0AC61DDT2_9FIRM|nr:glycoside hydrolase family 28 protein [Sporanaerobium hydrogeniformans]PHV70958.1 polygalacturonase [Sporanaerobium hydrogeniformans]